MEHSRKREPHVEKLRGMKVLQNSVWSSVAGQPGDRRRVAKGNEVRFGL